MAAVSLHDLGRDLRAFRRHGELGLSAGGALALSHRVDSVAQAVLGKAEKLFWATHEADFAYREMVKAPRVGGDPILGAFSPFEQQMVLKRYVTHFAIGRWVEHYRFWVNDQPVPIRMSGWRGQVTPWTVMIGATRGKAKALRYPDLADLEDLTPIQTAMETSLEALEWMRQTPFGAIKRAAHEEGTIDSKWTYSVEGDWRWTGGVEHVGQKKPAIVELKTRATGRNLELLVNESPDEELLPERPWEGFPVEGYDDDARPHLSAGELIEAISAEVLDRAPPDRVNRMVESMMLTRLGIPKTPALAEWVVARLY